MSRPASELIRGARRDAGLKQAELAEALGTTQSAVARLEAAGSSPTLRTLERVLAAMGKTLVLSVRDHRPQVDETLIAENLKLTPDQRLDRFSAGNDSLRSLLASVRRV